MPIHRVVPLFRVPDVDRTASWYREELGFQVDPFPAEPPFLFAILRREGAELMLRRSPSPIIASGRGDWDAYVRISGNSLPAFHAHLTRRGLGVGRMERMPYGMVEFELCDCDGRRVRFGEPLENAREYPPALEGEE